MTSTTFHFGNRPVGPATSCYLMAEVGTTCLGNLDMALRLVDAAADAGIDAVKFQLIDPLQDSSSDTTYEVVHNGAAQQVNLREMFSELEFSPEQWSQIKDRCNKREIEFLSTVDFVEGVDLLESLDVPAHKIGAWDTTYWPLIERIGRTGKPMLVDLGPTTSSEVDDLSRWYYDAGGSAVIFLHDFHTSDPTQMNMHAITHLREEQRWPVGFSSPNRNDDLDFVALTLGAKILEKRLILDRSVKAIHGHESLEPDELAAWVKRVRAAEAAMGEAAIRPSDTDRTNSALYYRSVCTIANVKRGEILTEKNLDARRPGTGVPSIELSGMRGRLAARDIPVNTLVSEDDLQ